MNKNTGTSFLSPPPFVGEGQGGGETHDVTLLRARKLRQNQTHVEKRLWYWLRRKNVHNVRFRRQAPIGSYIVDFACYEPKLIIELDGGQHALQNSYDKKRDTWLKREGFTVLRFWNNEVIENIDGVLQTIANTIITLLPPTLTLPHKGGRE